MTDLIEALQIFLKYWDPVCPFNCSHDVLYVNIDPKLVTDEKDLARLEELGFFSGEGSSDYEGGFYSYRYGSC